MRALCGAIIAAGAAIGLGLTSIGVGTRYQSYPYHDLEGKAQYIMYRHLDTSLMVAMTVLLIALVVGMGIAFVGLAYHHQRRHLESQHYSTTGRERMPV